MNLTRRGLLGAALAALVPHRRRPPMPFPQPPTSSITLPTGATSGARIVLDGNTNTITIYDANNVAVITITAQADVGGHVGPVITFNPDTTPNPSPFTQLGFITTIYNALFSTGTLVIEAPSLDPLMSGQAHLFLDSGTAAGGGTDSVAELTAGRLAELVAGTVRLNPTTDAYPKAGPNGADHNVVVGEWHTVNVTVTAGNTSGTAALNFTDLYSVAPKVIGMINSGAGGAIRATVFCVTKTAISATIRVDTNAALGATTTFPVDVLVLA